ncbi:inorganic phosphate transporter, partial [Aureobasidium pullulans]
TRYAIYAEWHYGTTSRNPDIKSAFDLTKAETKDVLKRISKTNVRAMGKALSKVAFSSPGIVMQVAIHQMESYDNLIDVVVECVRYFSMLGYDVLTCMSLTSFVLATRPTLRFSNNIVPREYQVAINIATLGGSILGQLGFGIAGDWLGRRKAYGLELIITVAAALGSAMASNGMNGSMSLIGWLIFWRLIMGIGVGADYPLSAVLCSEMAPTRLRGRMLTAVFMCQPLGQLLATLVPLVAIYAAREHLLQTTAETCDADCLKTLDIIWRLVLGLGAVPAAASLWFRLTIIESPRYTVDIVRDDHQAAIDVNRYFYSGDHISTRSFDPSQHDHDDEIHVEGTNESIHPMSIMEPDEVSQPPQASWSDIVDYFWHQGNYRTLVATSLTWLSLDLETFNAPHMVLVFTVEGKNLEGWKGTVSAQELFKGMHGLKVSVGEDHRDNQGKP